MLYHTVSSEQDIYIRMVDFIEIIVFPGLYERTLLSILLNFTTKITCLYMRIIFRN